MRKSLIVILVALAALGAAGRADAMPLSSIDWFNHSSYSASCDLLGPTEAAWMEFQADGIVDTNHLASPYRGRPFDLRGSVRTGASGPVETLAATLTIRGRDGDVTAQLAFPGGVSTSGLCRPWFSRVSFSVSDAPYVATWPDGTRELGRYSLVYSTSTLGLAFSMFFRFDELIAPPPPPPTDPTPPTLHLPDDMTVEATGPVGAVVAFAATAVEADGRTYAAACSPATRSTFPLGTTTVECTAGAARGSFDVTVVDTTPPQLTVPNSHDVNVFSESVQIGTTGFVVQWSARATDVVDGSVAVSCTHTAAAELPPGPTEITCRAIDAAGNRAERTFVLTLPSVVDAFDDLASLVEAVVGVPGLGVAEKLEAIRAMLVRAEESGTPTLLAAAKLQLTALGRMLKQNPITHALFATQIRWIERQVGVIEIRMVSAAQIAGKAIRALLAACPTCLDAIARVDAFITALEQGAAELALAELGRLEATMRHLRREGLVAPQFALTVLTLTRKAEQYLRSVD